MALSVNARVAKSNPRINPSNLCTSRIGIVLDARDVREYVPAMRLISKSEVPPLYTAKKWTTVIAATGAHDVWATVSNAGDPVAFGSESKMKEYAAKLAESDGVLYDPNKGA
jgi:hypothetical protein